MRYRALALFASIIPPLVFSAPAFAQMAVTDEPICTTVAYGGVYSAYAFSDWGVLAEDGPVAQGGVSRTCGNVTYDVWASTALANDDPYGKRGGDEIDFTISWADSFNSSIGTLEVEASASYWLVADFGRAGDDIIGGYVQVGRPFEVGSATLTPYVRVMEWIGVEDFPATTLLRPGVGISLPLSDQWSLDGDVSHVTDLNNDLETWRSDIDLTRSFENGWSITGSVKMADRMPTVYGLGFAKSF